ncbi:hypothetical protein WJX72_005328 [[Myrmecia] bisecta]|uniref:holo-[acyl-carrier-protein] synthase n=1 Tax=[Myrmecia] bisecta TaxID=41462 RepID=A0AAW1R7M8_9CHLO
MAGTAASSSQRRPNYQHSLQLAPGEVHIWWLNADKLTDDALLSEYEGLLSSEEQAGVSAITNAAVRKERLLARALVRTTLARYCGGVVAADGLCFVRNASGKPELSWPLEVPCPTPNLHFNLTHTRSLLGCAVTNGMRIGLDVERTDRHTRSDPLKLARRRFTPTEVACLADVLSPAARAEHFVRLWTLKEAYVKARVVTGTSS